ncbi:MAG: hypothetical protein WA970_02265 [Gammaproteobacteria bacterium]
MVNGWARAAAKLLGRCFENEGVDYLILGLVGQEERIEVMDVLLESSLRLITTGHEQGAALPGHEFPEDPWS